MPRFMRVDTCRFDLHGRDDALRVLIRVDSISMARWLCFALVAAMLPSPSLTRNTEAADYRLERGQTADGFPFYVDQVRINKGIHTESFTPGEQPYLGLSSSMPGTIPEVRGRT